MIDDPRAEGIAIEDLRLAADLLAKGMALADACGLLDAPALGTLREAWEDIDAVMEEFA